MKFVTAPVAIATVLASGLAFAQVNQTKVSRCSRAWLESVLSIFRTR